MPITGNNWGSDAIEVETDPPPSDSHVFMPLQVLAHFNRQKAVDLLIRNGMKRRVAKRHVSRILKIERLRKKRVSR